MQAAETMPKYKRLRYRESSKGFLEAQFFTTGAEAIVTAFQAADRSPSLAFAPSIL
jgi:hypothetical protein